MTNSHLKVVSRNQYSDVEKSVIVDYKDKKIEINGYGNK